MTTLFSLLALALALVAILLAAAYRGYAELE